MADDDPYDFTGVSEDLECMKTQLMAFKPMKNQLSFYPSSNTSGSGDNDDGEWYPPTPPTYDVADKLIEINRIFREDPTPTEHLAGKIKWRHGPALVQIKWLSNELDTPRTTENQLIFDGESFNTSSERIVILQDIDDLDADEPDDKSKPIEIDIESGHLDNRHANKLDLMSLELLNITLNDSDQVEESVEHSNNDDDGINDCFPVDIDNYDDYYNDEFDDDQSSCDDSKSVESDSTIPTSEDISVSPVQENFISGLQGNDFNKLGSLFTSSAFLESFLCDQPANSPAENDDDVYTAHNDHSGFNLNDHSFDHGDSDNTERHSDIDRKDSGSISDLDHDNNCTTTDSENIDHNSSSDLDHNSDDSHSNTDNHDLDNNDNLVNSELDNSHLLQSDDVIQYGNETLILNNYDSETFTQESSSANDDPSESKESDASNETSPMEVSIEDSDHKGEEECSESVRKQTTTFEPNNNYPKEPKKTFSNRPQRRSLPNSSLSNRPLHRKVSTQSTTSNSSDSSRNTETTIISSLAKESRRITGQEIRQPVSPETRAHAVSKWRLRKREEKRLQERRAFIEAKMRVSR